MPSQPRPLPRHCRILPSEQSSQENTRLHRSGPKRFNININISSIPTRLYTALSSMAHPRSMEIRLLSRADTSPQRKGVCCRLHPLLHTLRTILRHRHHKHCWCRTRMGLWGRGKEASQEKHHTQEFPRLLLISCSTTSYRIRTEAKSKVETSSSRSRPSWASFLTRVVIGGYNCPLTVNASFAMRETGCSSRVA